MLWSFSIATAAVRGVILQMGDTCLRKRFRTLPTFLLSRDFATYLSPVLPAPTWCALFVVVSNTPSNRFEIPTGQRPSSCSLMKSTTRHSRQKQLTPYPLHTLSC